MANPPASFWPTDRPDLRNPWWVDTPLPTSNFCEARNSVCCIVQVPEPLRSYIEKPRVNEYLLDFNHSRRHPYLMKNGDFPPIMHFRKAVEEYRKIFPMEYMYTSNGKTYEYRITELTVDEGKFSDYPDYSFSSIIKVIPYSKHSFSKDFNAEKMEFRWAGDLEMNESDEITSVKLTAINLFIKD